MGWCPRGCAMGEHCADSREADRFEITLQDLKGVFHPLPLDQVSGVTEEKQSLMPAVEAEPGELQDLIAFLSRLTGVEPRSQGLVPAKPSARMELTSRESLNPMPGDWLTYNGELSGNRYSQIKQINVANVTEIEPEVDLFDSPMVAVPAGHPVFSREYAVLRIGNSSYGGGWHHVCDRA